MGLVGQREEFRRALELNPGYWVTPYWYGIILTSSGRCEEAEQQIRCGMELEPLSPVIMHGAASNALVLRRCDEAIERCLRGLESDPDYFLLRLWLGVAYELEARYREAIQELQTAVDSCHRNVSWVVGALGHAYAAAGNQPEALRILEELLDRAKRETIDFTAVALIYVGMGDTENALVSLEKACDARGMSGVGMKVDPRYDALRFEPRFQRALRRMNLA